MDASRRTPLSGKLDFEASRRTPLSGNTDFKVSQRTHSSRNQDFWVSRRTQSPGNPDFEVPRRMWLSGKPDPEPLRLVSKAPPLRNLNVFRLDTDPRRQRVIKRIVPGVWAPGSAFAAAGFCKAFFEESAND